MNTQIVEDAASITNNEGKNEGNFGENTRDKVDEMVSHKNAQHVWGEKGNTDRVENKARPVNIEDSDRECMNSKDKEGDDLIESTQTVSDTASPIDEKEINEDNLNENSEDKVDGMVLHTNVHHEDGNASNRNNNGVENKAHPINTKDRDGDSSKDENNKESLRGKRSSSPESPVTDSQSPSKRSKFAQSASDVSDLAVSVSQLLKPSLRHKKRQFSRVGEAKSSSATLFKHLTVLQSGKVDTKRKCGKENEKKKDNSKDGQRGMEEFQNVASPVPHIAHKSNSRSGGASSLLPLCVDQKWYVDCGNRESHNQVRAECRAANSLRNKKGRILATNRSKVSGHLEDNIKAIDEKILTDETSEESKKLLAIKAVGEYLLKHPIMPTQEAGTMLQECSKKPSHEPKEKKSVDIYEHLAKHLNLNQIYISEKAFLMENRDCQLLDVANDIQKMFESFNFRSKLNTHVEEQIGNFYRTALSYLDTKRDRDTLKFLLTRVTSVNFMARLQGISNKKPL